VEWSGVFSLNSPWQPTYIVDKASTINVPSVHALQRSQSKIEEIEKISLWQRFELQSLNVKKSICQLCHIVPVFLDVTLQLNYFLFCFTQGPMLSTFMDVNL
jgi:hypothetical protein